MIHRFTFSPLPYTIFGPNKLNELKTQIRNRGDKILLLTGKNSFKNTGKMDTLVTYLKKHKISIFEDTVTGEPTPDFVDNLVLELKDQKINLVVSIGGGSVIDAGKAVSAMLGKEESVKVYLEGVGDRIHNGTKVPFIAVPTTAGTGSEATQNAVLRKKGENGFKKSLRHDRFIPDITIIDPALHLSAPPHITASCGMDAFTQLLESYVSTQASSMTDALAMSGLQYIENYLLMAFERGYKSISARSGMAYAAYLSGITLANAGLGTVHGFASVIGGLYDIPHGLVCGVLMGRVVQKNIEKLIHEDDRKNPALKKYAAVGRLFADDPDLSVMTACETLVENILELQEQLKLPALRQLGIKKSHLQKIAAETGNKYNPVVLEKEERLQILKAVY